MDTRRRSKTIGLVYNIIRKLEIYQCINKWTNTIRMYDKMVVIKSIISINVYLI